MLIAICEIHGKRERVRLAIVAVGYPRLGLTWEAMSSSGTARDNQRLKNLYLGAERRS